MNIQQMMDKSPAFKNTLEEVIHNIWWDTARSCIEDCGYCEDINEILWCDLQPFPVVYICNNDRDKAADICNTIEKELGLNLNEYSDRDFTEEEQKAFGMIATYVMDQMVEKTTKHLQEKYPHMMEEEWYEDNVACHHSSRAEQDEE